MELKKLKWKVPKGENGAHLAAIGDIHLGNRFHDDKPYKINMNWLLKHKEYKIITMGDLCECSGRHTLGLEDQIMEVDDQIDQIESDLQPFADEGRIIGMIRGNHERRTMKHASVDVTKQIAKYLNVPYLELSHLLYIRVVNEGKKRGQNYSIYLKHGKSFARTPGGRINAVMRMGLIVEADLYLHAHLHDLIHEIQDIYSIDRGNKQLKRRHYVVTGSYMKYGGYAEEAGYPPAGPSGSARVKFHSDEHRITVKI